MIILFMAIIGASYFFVFFFLLIRFINESFALDDVNKLKASIYGFSCLLMIALPISYALHGTSKGIGL